MSNGIEVAPRPAGYKPPTFREVSSLLEELRQSRSKKFSEIAELKRAREDNWDNLLKEIPASFRKMAPMMGFPDLAEMGDRIAGLITRNDPVIEVIPPSGRQEDIRKAAAEEVNKQMAKECYQIPLSWTLWGTPHAPKVQGLGDYVFPDGSQARNGAGFSGQFWVNALWIDPDLA